ncbi:MAG: hypothetical protein O3C62_00105 [Actinomycetota bacterium]|nr:hypothetical protein [Actinomycetota bacterium]MDA2970949.1 hypothetical protein [Actinomycetota bacterium]MDA3000065.1 hypothetical protein [Actinomycetota bacterium]
MFSFLRSRSLRQGFLRGGRVWSTIGVVVWGIHLVRRAVGRRPEVVTTESIRPGRSIVVSSVERGSRRR